MLKPDITAFFDPATSTYSYVVRDPSSRACAIVDPVLDYDPAAGRTSHASAERLIAHVRQHDLQVEWLLETHVHADHLSAAIFLQRELGGRLAIGARITQVQAKFSGLFNLGEAFPVDGRQFEHLFEDGESFRIGALECRALHTPGHTPACMTYLVGDSAFVGDTLFMPDYGTARCDFPGGDARQLYRSIQRLFALPDATRLFMCHDYGSRPRRAPLRNQRRRAAPAQRARPRRRRRGGVRRHAPAARCHPRHADPDAAGDPGQHARRQPAAGGRQRVRYLKIPLDLF